MPRDGSTQDSDSLSRRNVLKYGAGVTVTGLAGCSKQSGSGGGGDSGGSGDGGDGGSGGDTDTQTEKQTTEQKQMIDDALTGATGELPPKSNFNPYTQQGKRWDIANVLLQRPTKNFADGSIEKIMLDDYSLSEDGKEFILKINPDWQWHNGKDVTADDFLIQERIELAHTPPEDDSKGLIGVEKVDKYTAKKIYGAPQNGKVLAYELDGWQTYRPRWHLQPFLKRLKDASSQDKRDQIMGELQNLTIGMDDMAGTSPWKVEDYSATQITFKKWDKHPFADKIDIPKLELKVGKSQAVEQMLKQGALDYQNTPLAPSIAKSTPEEVQNISLFKQPRLNKLMFNRDNSHLAKRGVRRAISYALDYENIVKNRGENQFKPGKPTGMTTTMDKTWLGDTYGKLIDYGLKAQPDKAAQAMKSAGYSRNSDGKWADSNGNVPELRFPSPTWGGWVKAAKTISQQLKAFGINVNLQTMESSAWFSDAFGWQFDLVMMWNGSHSNVPHPSVNYQNTWLGTLVIGESASLPPEQKVPTEIGAKSLSGGSRKINLEELSAELKTGISDKRAKEITTTFAWWWNFDAHAAELMDNPMGMTGHRGRWNMPEKNAKPTKTKQMATFCASTGEIKPKYE